MLTSHEPREFADLTTYLSRNAETPPTLQWVEKRYIATLIQNRLTRQCPWIYIASQETQAGTPRLTVPPPVFDDVEILTRDRGGYLSVDTATGYLVISNRHPETRDRYTDTKHQSLNVSDSSRNFTIPTAYLPSNKDSPVPASGRLDTDMLRFFITTPERTQDRFRSCYVVSAAQLLELVESPNQWQHSPENRRRLADLLEHDRLQQLYPTEDQIDQPEESYWYNPTKAGTIEVTVDNTTLRARWFKPRGSRYYDPKPESLFVIETVCEIVDPPEHLVTSPDETKQYIAKYDPYGQFRVQSREGCLDHVPKAIRRAIQAGDWNMEEAST